MLGTPLAIVRQNTGQSIPSAADTLVNLDQIDWDPHGLVNLGADTIVVPSGNYRIDMQCNHPGSTGGTLRAAYVVDYSSGNLSAIGGKVITGDAQPAYGSVVGAGYLLNCSRTVHFAGTATLACSVYQDSGGPLTLVTANFGGFRWAISRVP